MSGLLELARDYIERMSNPVYGLATNEEYSLRFGQLLRSEGFASQLRDDIRRLRDIDALTSYGWLWLLGWAKSRRIELSEDLLFELYSKWSSVFVKAEIIETATMGATHAERSPMRRTLPQFPNRFLARLLSSATTSRDDAAEDVAPTEGEAAALLVALLQVASPLALEAASALLHHEWVGHISLVNAYWNLVDTLDADTREEWLQRIDAPSRPSESQL